MSFLGAVILGIVLAAPMLALAYFLPRARALDFLAIQLAGIATVYAGSSLSGGGFSVIAIELAGVTAFLACSLFGRWGSPAILAAGYIVHGAWDAVHHLGSIPTFLPGWYAPFCLAYDWLFGAFIGVWFCRNGDG